MLYVTLAEGFSSLTLKHIQVSYNTDLILWFLRCTFPLGLETEAGVLTYNQVSSTTELHPQLLGFEILSRYAA